MTNEEIQNNIEILVSGQARILQILESDDRTRQKGLVERVTRNEEILLELTIKNKARTIAAGTIGGLISILAAVIAWIIKTGLEPKL
jgi:hypothetical protein